MTVFVTGATGLVGRHLMAALTTRGDTIVAMSRSARPKSSERVEPVTGDPSVPGPWLDRVAECDAVVHLAGENLFRKRWTAAFKDEIRRSRVESTRLLAERLASGASEDAPLRLGRRLSTASAIRPWTRRPRPGRTSWPRSVSSGNGPRTQPGRRAFASCTRGSASCSTATTGRCRPSRNRFDFSSAAPSAGAGTA